MIVADPPSRLDPESLVARIIGELNANKAARILLLRALLTEEFLLLPDKVEKLQGDMTEVKQDIAGLKQDVAGLKQDVTGLKQDVTGLKQDVTGLKQDVTGLKQDVTGLKQDVTGLKQDVTGLKQGQTEIKITLDRIEGDLSYLKGGYAVNATQRGIRRLARTVNCWLTRQLNDDDLDKLARANDITDISKGNLESFRNADFVLEAEHRDTGDTHYIAVEVSYTGQAYDVRRAVRNAEYLTSFTGRPAHAVVSAVQITPEVEAEVAQGVLTWYQIPSKDMQPE